jgi:soluble lytic murein transglycosylase-like protein
LKKAVILLACACALLVPATAVGVAVTPSQAETDTTQADTNTEATAASEPQAEAAGDRLRAAYRHWRRKLERYGVWRGRNLVRAAASDDREPTARELRRSIRRMKRRFSNWAQTYEGRATVHRSKVLRIPDRGREHLRSIAWCESRNNPRAVGGGGAYRGLYQFSFSTWRVVGGSGDPAAAPRSEQTWRAWVLLKNHGSGHWPVCG